MPKSNNVKEVKRKLTPAERSQVAKDRWAKIRAAKATTGSPSLNAFVDESIDAMSPDQLKEFQEKSNAIMASPQPQQPTNQPSPHSPDQPPYPQNPEPEQPPVAPESGVYETKTYADGTVATGIASLPEKSPAEQEKSSPAPQLVPAAPKKQKRYTGPKEFSVALKAAESRLAKAIVERAQAAGQLSMLQAEIPSLIQIINALKGQSNIPAATYDPYGSVPNATAFQSPIQMVNAPQFQQPSNPLGAIQAAMDAAQVAVPVSKARGGVMLTPDVVGSLEGPDDDDIDRFITGSGADDKGWIGG